MSLVAARRAAPVPPAPDGVAPDGVAAAVPVAPPGWAAGALGPVARAGAGDGVGPAAAAPWAPTVAPGPVTAPATATAGVAAWARAAASVRGTVAGLTEMERSPGVPGAASRPGTWNWPG